MRALLILTTTGSEEEGEHIAEALIERRQASCVNLIRDVRSIFRWRGETCRESETLLLVKTLPEKYSEVAASIRELHSYDLPEILALPIEEGDEGFLEWMASSLGCPTSSETREV